MVISCQNSEGAVPLAQAAQAVRKYFADANYCGKRVLLIVPDNTRSGPIGEIFQMIFDGLEGRAAAVGVLFALGTHQPMTEEQMCKRLALSAEHRKGRYAGVKFFNHEWDSPSTFRSIGTISADKIGEISDGLFREQVDVAVNKLIFDYDELMILGPVFPHEVVGYSGGHKYIFPGIAAAGIINFFHWLGAVVTNPWINGNIDTPTRKVVETAAAMVTVPRKLFAVVAVGSQLKGLFIGEVADAWRQAAELSRQVHIVYTDRTYNTVLGLAPEMYDDIWTAGKVMYKLEPILADGATLIIYAPHITEVSYTHGKILDQIGYHTRDYFLKQWDRFKDFPRGVLAHSTHVKGIGTFKDGVEKPRVNVILATRIPKSRCDRINLGYMNPDTIRVADYQNRQAEGVLVVDHAGELLHRLKSGFIPSIPKT
jgi:nickel-dependent lactate racemase